MKNNNGTGNIFNDSLDELQKEFIKLEEDINSVDRKKEQLTKLKKEIDLKQEQLKKSAFGALLSKFDKILDLYPEHNINKNLIKTVSGKDLLDDILDIALKTESCTDINPTNTTICERCAILYLERYIEKEMANFYIM